MDDAEQSLQVDLSRQVRQHLEGLLAAGVEFLPEAPAPTFLSHAGEGQGGRDMSASAPPPPQPSTAKGGGVALFAGLENITSRGEQTTPQQRRHELTLLTQTVAGCSRCAELVKNRQQTVFGVGPIDTELCFVGEAPGYDEDQQGEPFVGPAGQLLNRIITACGFQREEVYICNIVKCRPPGNRQPLPGEAGNCREFLERQLELVRPSFICCLGSVAAQNLLGTAVSISRLRGSFQDYRGIPVMCTFHPAYLLRNPEKKKEVWDDMKSLLQRMGRPIPGR